MRFRADRLRRRLAVPRRLHFLGRRAGNRLGRPLLGKSPRRRPAGAPRLRRFLARLRVDGPAAPPQGARHLLPPEVPRRQGQIQRGPAALHRTTRARPPAATSRSSRCSTCSTPSKARPTRSATPSDESLHPRRRARRTHAPADRPHAQAAAAGRRQAADRLASGAAGGGRVSRGRHQSRPPWRADRGSARRRCAVGPADPVFSRNRRARWKPPAASPTPCRCSASEAFLVVNGDIWCDIDFGHFSGLTLGPAVVSMVAAGTKPPWGSRRPSGHGRQPGAPRGGRLQPGRRAGHLRQG